MKQLRETGKLADKRLAIELIARCKGSGFSGADIAEALIEYIGINSDRENDDRVAGVEWSLVHRLPVAKCTEILDGIDAQVSKSERPRYWTMNSALASTVQRLTVKALKEGSQPAASQLWHWLRFVDSRMSYDTENRNEIRNYFQDRHELRLEIQRIALRDESVDDGPWMAIIDRLPRASEGLFLSPDDAAVHLQEIAAQARSFPCWTSTFGRR